MQKFIFSFVITTVLFLILPSQVSARRLLPRARPSGSSTMVSGSGGVGVSIKFRGDRLAINATFSNLSAATSVNYLFSYNTRSTTQGASGSINVKENNTTREIIFGTCSHGVCRYDYGISNAKFVVTINLANGRRIVKTFRLRV